MRLPHLHSADGNFPYRGIEVEFAPFGGAQFARTHKRQGEQFECGPCFEGPLIVLDSSQQSSKGVRRDDCCARHHRRRYQCAAQRGRGIVLGAGGGNRVAENVAYCGSELTGSFVNATRLYLLEDESRPHAPIFPPIGRDPSTGRAKLMNHSNLRNVAAAFLSRRFFSSNSPQSPERIPPCFGFARPLRPS